MLMKAVVHLVVYAHRIVNNKKLQPKKKITIILYSLFFDEKISCGAR